MLKMVKHCEHCLCQKCTKNDQNEIGKRAELRVKAVLEDMGFEVLLATREEDREGIDLWVDGIPFQIKSGMMYGGKRPKYEARHMVVITRAHKSPQELPYRIVKTLKEYILLYGENGERLKPLLIKAKTSIERDKNGTST